MEAATSEKREILTTKNITSYDQALVPRAVIASIIISAVSVDVFVTGLATH